MLTLGNGADSKLFRDRLQELFRSKASMPPTRRLLSMPGAPIADALLHWIPISSNTGIWGYFAAEPFGGNRWGCFFGLDQGEKGQPLVQAVEINLPTAESHNLSIAGRILKDEAGRLYLAHRGGLGGGRRVVSMEQFARDIRGFAREEFEFPDMKSSELSFVIGAIEDPDFIVRLHSYVEECYRLRPRDQAEEPESKPAEKTRRGTATASVAVTASFNPEASGDGSSLGGDERIIRRLHGRVVNALQAKLPKSVNTSLNDLRPDLYVPSGTTVLSMFEVKSSAEPRDWFTAIGQLLVYSAGYNPKPRLVFVCPADIRNPAFHEVLDELGIRLVLFEDGTSVQFVGLREALADVPGLDLSKLNL